MQIDLEEKTESSLLPDSELPFRILILGDFSGRAHRGIGGPGLAGYTPIRVDRDNFEAVMSGMRVEISLPAGGSGARLGIRFSGLEDFHPDWLFENVSLFQPLREARHKLGSAAPSGSLLEQMLQELDGHVDAAARLDDAINGQMRALLHDPDFQSVEAAWRALFFLARGLNGEGRIALYVVDISKAELQAHLDAVHRLVLEQAAGTPGAQPWSLLAGNYVFGYGANDLNLLTRIGSIARRAGAPFLAEADADLPEHNPEWEALRSLPEAHYLGLSLPRFLLRLPYGARTSPTELFHFEEMPGPPRHNDYLWGNPAFACAYLLARDFDEIRCGLRPRAVGEIEGLPAHVYDDEGETALQPCAEVLLTESEVERILETGLMPLISIKDTDAIRLARFQSIAEPPAGLSGLWR